MYKFRYFFVIAISIFSFITLSACADIKGFFASSASSASMGSSSASLGSISASSASSDSSESISDSIFNSSNPFTKNDQYICDIIDLTNAYASFSPIENDFLSFQNGISAIATRNGIISWENNPKTYIAIGKGLKEAQLTDVQYQNLKQLLAGSDYAKMKDIQKGYEAK